MGSVDTLKVQHKALKVARIDLSKPLGIHEPKLPGDVGWDLEAMEDVRIPPMTAVDVPVNVRIELPRDAWAEIRPRSSISRRNLQVDAGTIDNGYRGPLYVLVRNMQLPFIHDDPDQGVYFDTGLQTITIKAGERIGQLVLYRMCQAWLQEVEMIDMTTTRGEKGFGSTGTGLENVA